MALFLISSGNVSCISRAVDVLHIAEDAISNALPHAEDISSSSLQAAHRRLLSEHRMGMLPMLIGATVCCAGSALYHLLWNHSCYTMSIFARVDYTGIVFLIAGHSMMGTYYTFYCRPNLAGIYIACVAVSTVPVILSFTYKRFEKPDFLRIRALIFIVYGLVCSVPVVHSGIIHRFAQQEWFYHFKFLIMAGVFYLTGAVAFATRWPERKAPGRFDTVCNSHQLLHFCVLVGAFLHWYGSYLSLVYRLNHGCSQSPLLV